MTSETEQVQYPLRERRKRKTRKALVAAATELFHEQGYEETTLEQIADRAGVHVQTLYRHFPTKESLVLSPDQEVFDRFRKAIESPERAKDTIEFWRDYVAEHALAVQQRFSTGYLKRKRTRDAVPILAIANQRLRQDYEDVLARSIARDMNVDPTIDRRPRLMACAIWGGHQHALRVWSESEGKLDLVAETLAVVDDVRQHLALLMADQSNRGRRRTAGR